ncbi:leucyl aminopeptidase [Cognatiyoonia koreensis]|uniref:Probable cytosol aminopeptidase n=1 Tax=Cognatiyoonia koreensis TaxID=364200 RepID=A0A1I0P099_9RHOB|nr:leucyl aminopeptidase [Cognatiyoonia koreensis]SEW06880.1 leucyl aminopeptidase [Cognatiyoonia koreensis]
MSDPIQIQFKETDLNRVADAPGVIAVFVDEDGKLDAGARKVNTLTRKAIARLAAGEPFKAMKLGEATQMAYPGGLAAVSVVVVKLPRNPDVATARAAGAALAKVHSGVPMLILAGAIRRADEIALGMALRCYAFERHQTHEPKSYGPVTMMASKPEALAKSAQNGAAVTEGVFFTRDLTNEPANVLTTDDFAARLAAMQELGLDVEILEEDALKELGMGALLCVGQGSASPSKVVVMRWNGGGSEAPFALVGKGVVFDTGGISLKPGAGMEDMTMDMGGAGVVAGVMRTLALRKAKANVVGLVGLVENMPSGTATRPGDVVTSMKGTTIEVINTDAEGRLVLADVLWYAQDRFKPRAMINLATLTGAIVIALGHENAGVFSNSEALAGDFLKAADAEGEGAWRMPMGPAYDKQLKSQYGDIRNSVGRPAGAITAAQFLGRFVNDDVPWCHLDIAGVASVKSETTFAPKGATGWGVMALNRLIADMYEG